MGPVIRQALIAQNSEAGVYRMRKSEQMQSKLPKLLTGDEDPQEEGARAWFLLRKLGSRSLAMH
jgi:hypothetical protein